MSARPIIAFTGLRGHGKTTAAEALTETYGYAHVNFADPVRDVCHRVYGVSYIEMLDPVLKETVLDRYPFKSPRELLQRIGTEMFRGYLDDTWVKAFERTVNDLLRDGAEGVVCSDCRFLNEAAMLRAMGASLIRITDPRKMNNHGDDQKIVDVYGAHASEREIPLLPVSMTIINDRTARDLRDTALLLAPASAVPLATFAAPGKDL
ncbi:deoxynucleotide monophosphate kinase [Brevundimonas phage vB_BpoS-Marchewka]|uniref:Deoxynucleotide monophosphate kinase n=1 Tax=Brevundimonas phage vB_BpoS-Marchewka TaxID=2948604 RepID=A0A9E7SR24_9CAUD|nr:deoxynucleotide monophosphate kinase [Brevundimonas phage vB_BpoS-Marchewka]UTC29483.1 deoxynucleotide monophosphate kinase [Brevundimonas phage vB_BpoS-Bambus]